MKISPDTLRLLKAFSAISDGLHVRPGSEISVLSRSKSVVAIAKVQETFEVEFAVDNLKQLLGILSVIGPDGEVTITDKQFKVSGNGRRLSYTLTSPDFVVSPKGRAPALPSSDVEVTISSQALSEIVKASATLGLSDVSIATEGDRLVLKASDLKNPTASAYSIDLDEYSGDSQFSAVFKADTLEVVPDDYVVTVSKAGLARWTSQSAGVTYFIALDKDSRV